jgi:CRP-like cAMP-binding protein
MLTIMERVDLLQNAEFFREVRTQSLARIAAIAQEVRFEPRQLLFSENEAADAMFILLEGEVTLTGVGREECKLSKFQMAGALALLAEQAHVETVRASQPALALRIGQGDLFDAMAEDIYITRGIMRALIRMILAGRTPWKTSETARSSSKSP